MGRTGLLAKRAKIPPYCGSFSLSRCVSANP